MYQLNFAIHILLFASKDIFFKKKKKVENTAFQLFLNEELPQFQYLLEDVEIVYFSNTHCK